MDLSVIIVTYNSERYILSCLNSILRAVSELQYEVLIVDNASTDRTTDLIKGFLHPLTLIENPANQGFAKAVNIGLRKCSGEFRLLINPDVTVQSDSLAPMIDFMRMNPRVGICGCRLLNDDGSIQYSKGSFPTLCSTLYRMVLPKPMRKYHLWGYEKPGKCDWVTGAFMLIRNETIQGTGPLDESYFVCYEDVDYCLSARRKGWLTFYFPGASIYHLAPYSGPNRKRNALMEKEIRESQKFYFKKNHPRASYYFLAALAFFYQALCLPAAWHKVEERSAEENPKKREC
jgi:hypothetical protein